MNIFVLDTNPIIAASYHCDQHLHKMVLESAQMLSTAAHSFFPHLKGHIYVPSYISHPCTKWVCSSLANMEWVCHLANQLNEIRKAQGCNRHKSMDVIDAICDQFLLIDPENKMSCPQSFAEAMFLHIKIRKDLSTVQKYQLYYQKKHAQWVLDKGAGMSYKNRSVPEFMQNLLKG